MIPNAFIAAQQVNFEATMKNDCLTFNINQLLRQHFFVTREQVMRLWKATSQKGEQYLNKRKVDFGVSDTAFRDFFVKDGMVYSVERVQQFEGDNAYASLKQFVTDEVLPPNKLREIVVSCTWRIHKEVLSHAGTFLRQETADGKVSIKYHFYEKGDHPLNYKKLFSKYRIINVLALKGRPVAGKEEEDKINDKMMRIMTGINENAKEICSTTQARVLSTLIESTYPALGLISLILLHKHIK